MASYLLSCIFSLVAQCLMWWELKHQVPLLVLHSWTLYQEINSDYIKKKNNHLSFKDVA